MIEDKKIRDDGCVNIKIGGPFDHGDPVGATGESGEMYPGPRGREKMTPFIPMQGSNVRRLDFGDALALIKRGRRVTRAGWNGRGMWISLNPGSRITVSEGRPLAASIPVGTEVTFCPYLIMKTVDGEIVPWVASQSDLLAEDWDVIVDQPIPTGPVAR